MYSSQEIAQFIDMRIALNGWQQLDCFENPVPKFGLTSPIIQDILDCWTDDRDRIRKLNEWMVRANLLQIHHHAVSVWRTN